MDSAQDNDGGIPAPPGLDTLIDALKLYGMLRWNREKQQVEYPRPIEYGVFGCEWVPIADEPIEVIEEQKR